jgi:glycosyltransferase involved in cell wall biosynthesis
MSPDMESVETPQWLAGWELPEASIHEFNQNERTKYCLIIPVLNEGERIRRQIARMRESFRSIDTYIVDGGSTDGSTTVEALKNTGLKGLLIKKGPGKLSAQIRLGLAYGALKDYQGFVLIDGNDKDDPAAIPEFISSLEKGYDHVQGSRFVSGGKAISNPASRIWAIRLLHAPLISFFAGYWYTDTTNGFRAYSRKFILDPRLKPFREIFSAYELHYYLAIRAPRLGFKAIEVPVTRAYPPEGPIPSKIKGLRGNWLILKTLLLVCAGRYNPHHDKR